MNKNKIATLITLLLIITMIVSPLALPDANADSWREPYPFVIAIDDPVGVGQELLLWFGITDMVAQPAKGWKDLTITVTKPDGKTETLGPFDTDPTGGTGTVYVPNQVGTYYFQVHFPEQVMEYEQLPRSLPAGTVLKSADSEKVPVNVQEEPVPQHPGFPLPTEYWTRPINAQFREWASIAGNYRIDELSLNVPPHSIYQPYNEAPETAHVLWRKRVTTGGLVGAEVGEHAFDDGTAYEGKWHAIVLGGILYLNVPWPYRSHYQGVRAIDLRTGEELWFKEGFRFNFGQLMYWDTYDMHGVFAYLWEIDSTDRSTWRAYDAYTGEWWFTLTNVPGPQTSYGPTTLMYGEKGEILVYEFDLANGWMALWNSTNIPRLYGDENYWTMNWATWRPYGKVVNASAPHNVKWNGEPYNPSTLPLGLYGYVWNKTIPTGLPGIVKKIREGVILGTDVTEWQTSANPVTYWAISTAPGSEGQLLFKKTYQVPGNLTTDIRDASAEDNVFVVGVKETRQWYGYSLTTGEKLWGPTESQPWSDWVGFAQRNWVDVIADGKLFSGNYGGVMHAYDVKTGELLWTYTAEDEYGESLMGPNWAMGIHFISDGKIYMGHFEHSSFDPMPRGSPTICLNETTGEEIWKIDIRTGNFMGASRAALAVIGDGVMVIQNSYDLCDYAIAKGPSATAVSVESDIITLGNSILVRGMVSDISPGTKEAGLEMRFPNGVPAVSDANMSAWMEYVYMQYPRPADITGVDVAVSVLDPNNNYYEVGRTTADEDGFFKLKFEPEVPGLYTIIAMFEGSKAYYGSFAKTAISVEEAPAATPEPTPTPASMADLYLIPGIAGIIIAIAVVGAILVLMLRKR